MLWNHASLSLTSWSCVYFFLVLFFLVEVFFLVEKVFLLNNNLIFWLSFWICDICLCNCLSWECICLMNSVRVSTDFSCFCSGWTMCPILFIWVVCFSSKLEMVASLIAFGVVEGFLALSFFLLLLQYFCFMTLNGWLLLFFRPGFFYWYLVMFFQLR